MNCSTYQDLLQRRLDGVGPEAPDDVRRHLAECPECRALDAAAGRLREGLRLLTLPYPPPDLGRRVLGRVVADRLARRRRRRRVGAALALAAGVLVALGVRLFGPFGKPPGPVEGPSPVAKVPAPKDEPVALKDSAARAGTAVASLATRTADETVGEGRLLIPVVVGPLPEELDLQPALKATTRSLGEASANVSAGFEPVTNSAPRALRLALRGLPPMGGTDKPGS
jgi:hypothetical protein